MIIFEIDCVWISRPLPTISWFSHVTCSCRLQQSICMWCRAFQCRIYASLNWISIGAGNCLSPVQRQVITRTNAGFCLSIGLLEQISVKCESEFYHFLPRNCIWNFRLPNWRPFCREGVTNVGPVIHICHSDLIWMMLCCLFRYYRNQCRLITKSLRKRYFNKKNIYIIPILLTSGIVKCS